MAIEQLGIICILFMGRWCRRPWVWWGIGGGSSCGGWVNLSTIIIRVGTCLYLRTCISRGNLTHFGVEAFPDTVYEYYQIFTYFPPPTTTYKIKVYVRKRHLSTRAHDEPMCTWNNEILSYTLHNIIHYNNIIEIIIVQNVCYKRKVI